MRDINGSKPTNFPLDESKLSFHIPRPDRPPREMTQLEDRLLTRC